MPELTNNSNRKVQRTIQLTPKMLARANASEKATGCRLNRFLEASVLAYCEILNDDQRSDAMGRVMAEEATRRLGEATEPCSR